MIGAHNSESIPSSRYSLARFAPRNLGASSSVIRRARWISVWGRHGFCSLDTKKRARHLNEDRRKSRGASYKCYRRSLIFESHELCFARGSLPDLNRQTTAWVTFPSRSIATIRCVVRGPVQEGTVAFRAPPHLCEKCRNHA